MAKSVSKLNTKSVPTSVRICGCSNVFQDSTYGEGRRLHNAARKFDPIQWRCTVCGALKA